MYDSFYAALSCTTDPRPAASIAPRNASLLTALIAARGGLSGPEGRPARAIASLIGPGFVSRTRARKRGRRPKCRIRAVSKSPSSAASTGKGQGVVAREDGKIRTLPADALDYFRHLAQISRTFLHPDDAPKGREALEDVRGEVPRRPPRDVIDDKGEPALLRHRAKVAIEPLIAWLVVVRHHHERIVRAQVLRPPRGLDRPLGAVGPRAHDERDRARIGDGTPSIEGPHFLAAYADKTLQFLRFEGRALARGAVYDDTGNPGNKLPLDELTETLLIEGAIPRIFLSSVPKEGTYDGRERTAKPHTTFLSQALSPSEPAYCLIFPEERDIYAENMHIYAKPVKSTTLLDPLALPR
jgi:hypothetical protein